MKGIFLLVCFLMASLVHAKSLKSYQKELLALDDLELISFAMEKKIGSCSVSDARSCKNCACDWYVKTSKHKESLKQGLPGEYGTGCVVAPHDPKQMKTCWGKPNTYHKYQKSKTPICTNNRDRNIANMLRIGIKSKKDTCQLKEFVKTL